MVNPLEQMLRDIVIHLYNFFIFNQKNIFIVLQVVYIIVFNRRYGFKFFKNIL